MLLNTLHEPSIRFRTPRAWYSATIESFTRTDSQIVFAQLARNPEFDLSSTQRDAWLVQIELLKEWLVGFDGVIYLEFSIPRMGRRVDAVVVIGPVLFVIEFKVNEKSFDRGALEQVWDYALDFKNFHAASHSAAIVPILVATGAQTSAPIALHIDADNVCRPIAVYPGAFIEAVRIALRTLSGLTINPEGWAQAPYLPTPTIIEAARSLYAQHSVEAIARFDAGATNLAVTSRHVETLIAKASQERKKVICFVTGVPGAGKTLVGLNIATDRLDSKQGSHAVFLSGNGPLVAVLREALTRDEVNRQRKNGVQVRKGNVGESVKAFIQNVHHFRDDALADSGAPTEHVVIFDEAQRAWNHRKTATFMHRKKNQPGFTQSEPEFLISFMDRHVDWAVIVCLVGDGQEIHDGEAGIGAWLQAVLTRFPQWEPHLSSRLVDAEYASGSAMQELLSSGRARIEDSLHLSVSMRSFRAENVSDFVKALLDCDKQVARNLCGKLSQYPIRVTRDLQSAKKWILDHARGSERYGMVASSKAMRLKPHAVDIRVKVDPVHWFLNDKDDTRSSYYLEDAATEFQVQGLELDWACVTWDGDFRYTGKEWTFHDFRGTRWTNVRDPENRMYLRNAYRVLLTRARQGMVIFVPSGDRTDPTRDPSFYNRTFDYLCELGIPVLAS
jgi:hypothetical protein